MTMEILLPLDQMSVADKLQAMEALWADLTRNAGVFDSPDWHADVLRERDQRIAGGQEQFVEWEQAKRELRERLR